jgi:hypothetical protein
MDGRLLGIPAAAALLVGVPLVLTQTVSQPAPVVISVSTSPQTAQSEPKAATLKVRLKGSSGGPHPAFIGLRANGQAPEIKTVLVDETGSNSATVERAKDAKNCAAPRPRATGVGTDVWCLVANSVEAGHELTGTVSGTGTKLALTIDRKNEFWWGWPLVVLVAGLIVAALVTLWPPRLKALVQRLQLDRLVAGAPIIGLGEWINDQRAQGVSEEALLQEIAPVVSQGPAKANKARDQLKQELAQAKDLPDSQYKKEAENEAARTDHSVSDFFQADGKPRASHPAAEYSPGIKKMRSYFQDLEALRQDVGTRLLAACQVEPLLRIHEAQVALELVKTNEDLNELDARLTAARAAYVTAMSREECLAVPEDAAWVEEEFALGFGTQWHFSPALLLDEPAPFEYSDVTLRVMTVIAWALTAVTCFSVLFFAGATVYYAAYAPNNTFATRADYFKLFSAALASGAAATVLALLAYWKLPKATPAPTTEKAVTTMT